MDGAFAVNHAHTIFARKAALYYLATLAWMGVIFWFSHQPSDASSGQSGIIVESITTATGVTLPEVVVRKSAHFIAYAILGTLVAFTVLRHTIPAKTAAKIAALIVVAYAIGDEFHQLFIPGRSGEVADILLDSVAGILAILFVFGYRKRFRLQKHQGHGKI